MKKRRLFIILIPIFLIALVLNLKISKVEVSGNSWYSAEEIEESIFPNELSRNTLFCMINKLRGKKKTIPFVQDYSIILNSPFEAELIVYEKSIIGYVPYLESNMYFDKDGVVVESSKKLLEGIPLIKGLQFNSAVLYKPLPVGNEKIFNYILHLTQLISVYKIDMDAIELESNGNATLIIGDIEVLLGNNKNIDEKISELHDILPEIKYMKGTLYLDSYTATDQNKMYTFKKK